MPRKRVRGLEEMADALRKGGLSDAEYERDLNRMLGMELPERDREAEGRWERRRRRRPPENES